MSNKKTIDPNDTFLRQINHGNDCVWILNGPHISSALRKGEVLITEELAKEFPVFSVGQTVIHVFIAEHLTQGNLEYYMGKEVVFDTYDAANKEWKQKFPDVKLPLPRTEPVRPSDDDEAPAAPQPRFN